MLAALLAGTVLAGADCPLQPTLDGALPTAIHLVVGPLPPDGDPRLIHHLEHLAVRAPSAACARSRGAELDAYTAPDTLHLIWRGAAGPHEIDLLSGLLVDALHHPGPTSWGIAAREIAVEQALTPPSATESLLRTTAAPAHRLRLDLRGAVTPDLPAALDEMASSPITVITAVEGVPVVWDSSLPSPQSPAELIRRTATAGVSQGWDLRGTASCLERRAVWAALEGLAQVTEGSAIGWWGRNTGVLALTDNAVPLSRRVWRQALQPALDYDRAAVEMTARRARDVGDRSWMAAGALGLGVCPATAPLDPEHIRQALGKLRGGGVLQTAQDPQQLDLPHLPWAAVWQAGEPPAGWTDTPGRFHSRTPGGYTVDGPAVGLTVGPAPSAPLSSTEDNVMAQVLTVVGAHEQPVPCQARGLVEPSCTAPGALRVPDRPAVVVVDRPGTIHVTEVRAVPANGGASLLRFDRAPDAPGVRGYRHTLEPVRSVRDWSTVADGALLLPAASGPPSSARAARLAARPWLAVHLPDTSAPVPPVEDSACVRIFEGPADLLLPRLAEAELSVDHVWLPAQLAAEAAAIRSE